MSRCTTTTAIWVIFRDSWKKAGISQEDVDMNNYAGLTARELQSIVDGAIKTKQIRESKKEA